MPQGGKILSYYDLGDSNFVNADEWNINLNNEQELRKFAEKQELDLLWSICGELTREKDKYNIIKEITNEEIENFCNEYDPKIRIDKNQLNDRIKRLEALKSKLIEGGVLI